jgi:hypothetical protein
MYLDYKVDKGGDYDYGDGYSDDYNLEDYDGAILKSGRLPIARVNLLNKKGKAYSVIAFLTPNKTAVYYDPLEKIFATTAKAPVEVLTCIVKGVKSNFMVTTPRYKQKQLCCE